MAPFFSFTDNLANEQLLYFTSSSFVHNSDFMAVISDRGHGGADVARLNRKTKSVEPLTEFTTRGLACYPYFDHDASGLNKSSLSLHSATGDLYFVSGQLGRPLQVNVVNVHSGQGRQLAELPAGWTCGYSHIYPDNRRLLLPCPDERIVEVGAHRESNAEISSYFRANALTTRLLEVDTVTGETKVLWEEPDWVTHVQYHPTRSDCILFNHEWTWPIGLCRLWLKEESGRGPRRVRDSGIAVNASRCSQADDDVSHEVWTERGESVIYHGWSGGGSTGFLGRYWCESGRMTEIDIPDHLNSAYGHFMPNADASLVVTDSLLELPGQRDPRERLISVLRPDWDAASLVAHHLGPAVSSWKTQDEHPHPVFSPNGDFVFFTSDREGKRGIYAYDVSDLLA